MWKVGDVLIWKDEDCDGIFWSGTKYRPQGYRVLRKVPDSPDEFIIETNGEEYKLKYGADYFYVQHRGIRRNLPEWF